MPTANLKKPYHLVNFVTREEVHPHNMVFTGGKVPWEVVMDWDQIQSQINIEHFKTLPPSLGKYLPFLPIQHPNSLVTLKEAATPLLKSKVLGPQLNIDLYFKVEGKNPTGSFKDRGSAIDLTVAKDMKAKAIILASTGNMAASCAAYAAAAGLPCYVLVPEGVALAKMSQVLAFGGKIVQIKGTYNEAAHMAEVLADRLGFYLAGDYAFRIEGAKTAAFEVMDQLYLNPPDIIIQPMGCGTNLAAYHKGLQEYKRLGLIPSIPKLIGIEASSANAIGRALRENLKEIPDLKNVQTLASAIAVPNPLDGLKALKALQDTGGTAIDLEDMEMLEAQIELSSSEGLFVELASAGTWAGLKKLSKEQNIQGQTIVLVLSGDGLKDSATVLKTAIKPATIKANINDFIDLYDRQFFKGKSFIFVEKSQIIFQDLPDMHNLDKVIQSYLHTQLSKEYLNKIHRTLFSILQKGKHISFSDLQDAIQNALEIPNNKENKQSFRIEDFHVETAKDQVSQARVQIRLQDQDLHGQAQGVGPVDALIKALKACGNLHFDLIDYKVNIRDKGVDAVVLVDMTLQQGKQKSIGQGTSSDIIQASLEAFENAYNGLN